MGFGPPVIDYRRFRFSKLNTPEYSHLKLLFYWPVFGLLFLTVERLWIRESYYPISCELDSVIPFCEFFLIPYLFWFAFLVGIHIYTLLYDVESFKKLMKFIIFSYSAAMLIYIVFPNCQELRPVAFQRDNLFTRFLEGFYQFDTNTNVCPSIHCQSTACMAIAFSGSTLTKQRPWLKAAAWVWAALICASTVFTKQHSIIDVVCGLVLVAVWVPFLYGKKTKIAD